MSTENCHVCRSAQKWVKCWNCNGTGSSFLDDSIPCNICNGDGGWNVCLNDKCETNIEPQEIIGAVNQTGIDWKQLKEEYESNFTHTIMLPDKRYLRNDLEPFDIFKWFKNKIG